MSLLSSWMFRGEGLFFIGDSSIALRSSDEGAVVS